MRTVFPCHDTTIMPSARGRRAFLKSLAAAGVAAGSGLALPSKVRAVDTAVHDARVSFVHGTDRRQMVFDAMKPFADTIAGGITGKNLIIKPNNVLDDEPLCATHPDAIRGAIDFLRTITDQPITVAESTVSPNGTWRTFETYGYRPLEREFANVRLRDLNTDTYTTHWIKDNDGYPLDIKIIDAFLDPANYFISLARMKTHDSVVVTLAFKNMIMASPINVEPGHPAYVRNQFEKAKMHQGGPVGINYNMFRIARHVRPQFSVIDGTVGMEGNGPAGGTPVEHGVMLAGPNVVSVDRVGAELMGFAWEDIGYLQWCARADMGEGNLSKITVLGPDPDRYRISYRPHDNIERQMGWKNG